VIPTVIEPLREDWKIVLAQVRRLTRADVPSNKDKAAAVAALREFHRKLCGLRVLDPACGSGNFLYVTYDLLKRLEAEVLRELYDLSRQVELITILPSQFLGLERNVRAREVADLVLWIGHLQWRHRQPDAQVREPVLEEYKNIVAQDAVLAWDRQELVRDERGKPRLIWDMHTTTADPVTGRPVPDTQHGMVPMYSYTKPRAPEWPEADFIVGNPPFVGHNNMRNYLGDGYTEALRAAWPHIPSRPLTS
jgi:SAM-dependent methyltransferase